MRDCRVRHIMTAEVVSIEVHEPVTELIRLFASYPVHHLPVIEQGEVRGMVSSADMLKFESFIPKSGVMTSAALLNERFKIKIIMRQPVVTAAPDDTIEDAASRMVSHGVHALPVVNETRHLIGIVTTTDIMQALLHGIGLRSARDQTEVRRTPSELELRGALDAAERSTVDGTDTQGVGAALLYVQQRNERLEQLRQNVARYLHGGAEDAQLHSRLMKNIELLDGSAKAETFGL
jgi:CBS domain-containing protein